MNGQVAKYLFTRSEYHRMGEAGILSEDNRVELLDGEIIQMTPIGSRHAGCVGSLNRLFSRRLDQRVFVWPQNPIVLNDYSEPQPDVVLLRPRPDNYRNHHPEPADIFLVVEVMDTSAPYDRGRKLPAYANSRISEVWLVDLDTEVIEMHRKPRGGTYHDITSCRRGQRLSISALPGKSFRVNEILG